MIDTAGEIAILVAAIKQHGSRNDSGKHSVEYGVLFDKTANTRKSSSSRRLACRSSYHTTVEALNGTLRSARRQKLVIRSSCSWEGLG